MNPRIFEKLFGLRFFILAALILLIFIGGILIVRSVIPSNPATIPTVPVLNTPVPINTRVSPTDTLQPNTPEPVNTPVPTATAVPTATLNTPIPTATIESTAIPTLQPPIPTNSHIPYPTFDPRKTVNGYYTVQWGDNLPLISQDLCKSQKYWLIIYLANKNIIKDPKLIYPGQVFYIPCLPKGSE